MKNTLTIARREMRSFFDSLVAYVVVGLSIIICGLWFFVASGGIWQIDRANFSRMFEALPWLLSLIVIPLVTMRSIAEEKRSGTLELLITMPVKDTEVILGKYFAALAMVLILLAATLLYPVGMFVWPWHLGALDWGPVWAGYLGCVCFSAAAVGVGMMLSSLTESDVVAFFMTLGVLGVVYAIGWIVSAWHADNTTGSTLIDALGFLSFQTRYQGFAKGLIDTRAIVYFASVTVLCLLVAFRSLESRKWS